MCQRSLKNPKSVYKFSTLPKPLPMRRCRWHSNRDPRIEMRIAPYKPTKDFYAQWKNLCIHPKFGTKTFNHSNPISFKETRFLQMKSITYHSILKESLRIPNSARPKQCHRCRRHSNKALEIVMRIAPCQPIKDFYASIQEFKLKYSITPNLHILRKLDFCKWNQLITTQNPMTLHVFQVEWACRQAVGIDGLPMSS